MIIGNIPIISTLSILVYWNSTHTFTVDIVVNAFSDEEDNVAFLFFPDPVF